MITYGQILSLWQFALSWLMQCQPPAGDIYLVMNVFKKLGRAIVLDTGLENFHTITAIQQEQIGPATRQWLIDARPTLKEVYQYFDDLIEMMVNPRGD